MNPCVGHGDSHGDGLRSADRLRHAERRASERPHLLHHERALYEHVQTSNNLLLCSRSKQKAAFRFNLQTTTLNAPKLPASHHLSAASTCFQLAARSGCQRWRFIQQHCGNRRDCSSCFQRQARPRHAALSAFPSQKSSARAIYLPSPRATILSSYVFDQTGRNGYGSEYATVVSGLSPFRHALLCS